MDKNWQKAAAILQRFNRLNESDPSSADVPLTDSNEPADLLAQFVEKQPGKFKTNPL